MATIEEKLKELRLKYPSNESQKQIDEDEIRLRDLLAQKGFYENDFVKIVMKDAKSKISDLNFMLSYDEDLNKPENNYKRYALFKQREVWEFVIDRFGGTVDQQLDALERDIDNELNK